MFYDKIWDKMWATKLSSTYWYFLCVMKEEGDEGLPHRLDRAALHEGPYSDG